MNQNNKIEKKIRILILAGGNASRINAFNSQKILIKPFLEIGSQAMIFHIFFEILSGLQDFFGSKENALEKITLSIVVNKNFQEMHFENISKFIKKIGFEDLKIEFIFQEEQNGTGGAVFDVLKKSCFKDEFHENDLFFVFFGDHPLVEKKTILDFFFEFEKFSKANSNAKLAMFGCFKEPNQENQYGRIEIFESSFDSQNSKNHENLFIKKIHEYKDFKDCAKIKQIKLCNGPISLFQFSVLSEFLPFVLCENNAKEIYLHGLIEACFLKKANVLFKAFVFEDSDQAAGVNTFEDLHEAEKKFQLIQRKKFLKKKIQFQSIETIVFAPFVLIEDSCQIGAFVQFLPFLKIGKFSKIESFCVLGQNLEIGANCLIKSHSVLQDSKIGDFCEIGPFAHLNSCNIVDEKNIIGNFVEIKRSKIGPSNKAKHFAYIADAKVGFQNNFGAGTIFCNYDGKSKNQINIGDKNFIGANVSLIAPLTIGNSNLVGAGSVITENIEDRKLALERSKQINKDRKN